MVLRYSQSNLLTRVKMLLASAKISACLIVPTCGLHFSDYGIRTVEIPIECYAECVGQLAGIREYRSQTVTNLLPPEVAQTLVYPAGVIATPPTGLEASDFAATGERIYHLNLTSIDTPIGDIASAPNVPYLRSLDLSRLNLSDDFIHDFFSSAQLLKLHSIDLSGNHGVTETGVRCICEAINAGRLSKLDWLDLTGTDFDASPYIDGHYWRINNHARHLAEVFGFQRWMMLGSRIPELENVELLTSEQREIAYGRLMLA